MMVNSAKLVMMDVMNVRLLVMHPKAWSNQLVLNAQKDSD
jgi:hypothetical protein